MALLKIERGHRSIAINIYIFFKESLNEKKKEKARVLFFSFGLNWNCDKCLITKEINIFCWKESKLFLLSLPFFSSSLKIGWLEHFKRYFLFNNLNTEHILINYRWIWIRFRKHLVSLLNYSRPFSIYDLNNAMKVLHFFFLHSNSLLHHSVTFTFSDKVKLWIGYIFPKDGEMPPNQCQPNRIVEWQITTILD